jgi:hypothetical protein
MKLSKNGADISKRIVQLRCRPRPRLSSAVGMGETDQGPEKFCQQVLTNVACSTRGRCQQSVV